MRIRKYLLSLFLLPWLMTSLLVQAQSSGDNELQRIFSSFKNVQTVSGEFEQQKLLPILTRPFVSNGRFLSVKNHGLLWETFTPTASQMIMTKGQAVQVVDGRRSEYKVTGTPYDGLAILLPALLNGDEALLTSYFAIETQQASEHWELILTPHSCELAGLISEVIIRGQQDRFTDVQLSGSQGDQAHIYFKNMTMNSQLPDEAELAYFRN